MITRTLCTVLLAASSLLACDKKDEPAKTETVKKTTTTTTTTEKKAGPTEVAKQPDVAPTTAAPEPAPPVEADPLGLDNDRVIAIATAARELEGKPEDAEAVLERHGLDRPTFEAAVTEIAKDPWKTDLYIAALGQADQG